MIINLSYPNGSDIQFVNKPDKSQDPFSRYKSLLRLTTTNNQTFIETWKYIEIPDSTADQYHYVEPGESNRIDLIAYRYYGVPQLWWVIAMANNITNPLSIPSGMQLKIPSINTLYQFGGILA